MNAQERAAFAREAAAMDRLIARERAKLPTVKVERALTRTHYDTVRGWEVFHVGGDMVTARDIATVVGWCLARDGGEGIGVTVVRGAAHFDGVGVFHEGTITITISAACATRLYSPTGVL